MNITNENFFTVNCRETVGKIHIQSRNKWKIFSFIKQHIGIISIVAITLVLISINLLVIQQFIELIQIYSI